MSTVLKVVSDFGNYHDESLFARIANGLESAGYSIIPAALSVDLTEALYRHSQNLQPEKFVRAGIGRAEDYIKNEFVRTDEICWITGESQAGRQWLGWTHELQQYLNRRLFLGLFSFESHFAHYSSGDYYKRHLDAFKGEANRVLSVVVYLNPGWTPSDGGELLLYQNDEDKEGIKVTPLLGTMVIFLSEEFPHEVLPAHRDRYSIAGWFRVNGSVSQRVDPPR